MNRFAVPLPLVFVLGNQSEKRRSFPIEQSYAHFVTIKDDGQNMGGARTDVDGGWDTFMGRLLQSVTNNTPDSVALLYTAGTAPDAPYGTRVDFGLLVHPHQPPIGFVWHYGPEFTMSRLQQDIVDDMATKAAGLAEVQQMLDREHAKH